MSDSPTDSAIPSPLPSSQELAEQLTARSLRDSTGAASSRFQLVLPEVSRTAISKKLFDQVSEQMAVISILEGLHERTVRRVNAAGIDRRLRRKIFESFPSTRQTYEIMVELEPYFRLCNIYPFRFTGVVREAAAKFLTTPE